MSTRRAHHFIVEKIFVSNIASMTKNYKFWTRVVVRASWAVFPIMDRYDSKLKIRNLDLPVYFVHPILRLSFLIP